MKITPQKKPTVLAIGVENDWLHQADAHVDFRLAEDGGYGVDLLSVVHFDLTLIGADMPDSDLCMTLKQMHATYPKQRWALIGSAISDAQEILARSFGAVAIFDAPPDQDQIVSISARGARRDGFLPAPSLNRQPARVVA
jgi:DNA-binding NtrC family response regulator